MSIYRIVPGRLINAMLEDIQREHRRSKAKKICLCLGLLISVAIFIIFLSGCYTARVLYLEAQCGIGRDYACISRWFEAGDPNNPGDNELRMVCGCVDKEDLKRKLI